MNCKACGTNIERSYAGMCEKCYKYYKTGGTDNPLPPAGVIKKDYRGYVVCHICGRAYKRLGSHVRLTHHMTIAEYKEEFGLCNNAKTTEAGYSAMMSRFAYINGMDKRLLIVGKNTQIKKGETDKRKGKKCRLQESIEKKQRYCK